MLIRLSYVGSPGAGRRRACTTRLRYNWRSGASSTLAEIEVGMPLLAEFDPAAGAASPGLRAVLRRKLVDIDARIAGLNLLREQLSNELERPGAVCPLEADFAAAGVHR